MTGSCTVRPNGANHFDRNQSLARRCDLAFNMSSEPLIVPASLRRTLTLPMVVLYVLGVTIGAGIYVLVGEAAGRAGMAAPISFVIAGMVMICPAASFAELAGRLPFAAGEARFVDEAFRQRWLTLAIGLAVACVGVILVGSDRPRLDRLYRKTS